MTANAMWLTVQGCVCLCVRACATGNPSRSQISHLEQALAAKEASAREEGERAVNVTSELHKTIAELSKANEVAHDKLMAAEDELSIERQQSTVQKTEVRATRCATRRPTERH